ncbi:MAG: hypothetical protein HDQ96_05790 [Lachnospiraceae bacterium]|nr:hypothetical protein [Lachnospiraceae bacterium]
MIVNAVDGNLNIKTRGGETTGSGLSGGDLDSGQYKILVGPMMCNIFRTEIHIVG